MAKKALERETKTITTTREEIVTPIAREKTILDPSQSPREIPTKGESTTKPILWCQAGYAKVAPTTRLMKSRMKSRTANVEIVLRKLLQVLEYLYPMIMNTKSIG
jgi:hypothetical protein